MNYLFTLLLCIMEYSLKEEDCTMDDMAAFLSDTVLSIIIRISVMRKVWILQGLS